MNLKIRKITEVKYKGKVYDLSFNNKTYFYIKHIESKVNSFIKIKNCDIDWDSSEGAREAILEYLISKYGKESVINVPTFGTYKAKSALQAMSRGLKKETGHDTILMKKITKLSEIADDKKKWEEGEIISYFNKVKEITTDQDVYNWIEDNTDTIDFSNRIMGQINQLGMHAGGIVITPKPIYNYVPVTRGSGNLITAFREADGSSKDLGELGILKLDVLGLSTLNILKSCVEGIKKDKGIDLADNLSYLDINDKKVLDYFAAGNCYGIFQMERAKMFTDKIDVDSFEDIVAINAINRPGPLEKYLNKYGYWKNIDKGKIKITEEELKVINKERYPLPFMENVLKDTYGTMIFQEQLMFLLRDAAGFDLGKADNFRRSLGWKTNHPKYYILEGYFKELEGALVEKGYSKADSDFFIQYCKDFAGYSFAKAHAVCYSYITFQTLYFKYYYPAYFYAAMINSENDIEKLREIIADAQQNKIEILPHSIIKSDYLTTVESDNSIRMGLGMIKGFGNAVQDELTELKLKECITLSEIFKKQFKKINSTQLQNLIDLGAFDELEKNKNKIIFLKDLYTDDTIQKWFTRKTKNCAVATMPKILSENFDVIETYNIALEIRNQSEPWILLINKLIDKKKFEDYDEKKALKEKIRKQKELLGFTIFSDNKLKKLKLSFKTKGILPLSEFDNPNKKYYFQVEKKTVSLTKNGKSYLNLQLFDGEKSFKVKCWRELDLEEENIYWAKFKQDKYGFTIDDREVIKL